MAKQTKQSESKDFVKEKSKKPSNPPINWGAVITLQDDKAARVFGLFLVFFSIGMFLALFSYLFTWHEDHSLVTGELRLLGNDPEQQAANWIGILGAKLAHQLMYKWLGVSGLAVPFILFLWGFKLLVKVELFNIRKTIKMSFFVLIWLSLVLGYLFSSKWQFLGGGIGYFMSAWLNNMIGYAGTGFFIVLYALIFSVLVFNLKLFEAPKRPEPSVSTHKKEEAASIIDEAEKPKTSSENKGAIREHELLQAQPLEKAAANNTESSFTEELKAEDSLPDLLPKEEGIQLDILPSVEEEAEDTTILSTNELTMDIVIPEPQESIFSEDTQPTELPHYGPDSAYDPRLDLSHYQFPTLDLMKDYGSNKSEIDTGELQTNKNMIVETLKNYNIGIAQIKATVGPTVTLYEIVPEAGVRISKIKNLEDDIALSLAALGIRIIAPIPGKGTIGIEVPNKKPEMVPIRAVIGSQKFQNSDADLPICLGKTISNEIFVADLAKMPHLLMAGATGQGKSVGINAVLVSLLYRKHPAEVKFVLVDPKKVELNIYKTIERHFLAKLPGEGEAIITDTKLVTNTLNSLCVEMDHRYDLLKAAGVRGIKEYNAKFLQRRLLPTEGHKYLPYIVVVIDELADLMMTAGKEVEYPIGRLAQLARAIGIHLILATQRPSVNVITGTIKANFPGRIAFRVTSKIDSRTILDANGADQLIGRGDLLFSNGSEIIRLQCPFVDTPEVEAIAEFIGNQRGYGSAFILPEYAGEDADSGHEDFDPADRDVLFDEAARIVVQTQQGSTSLLQRRLKLGYNRAGRLIDQLEKAGIVGAFEGSKAREVKIRDEVELERILNNSEI